MVVNQTLTLYHIVQIKNMCFGLHYVFTEEVKKLTEHHNCSLFLNNEKYYTTEFFQILDFSLNVVYKWTKLRGVYDFGCRLGPQGTSHPACKGDK